MSEIKIFRETNGVLNSPYFETTTPTRRCLVCDCLENPKATTVRTESDWLCKRCKSVLLKVIERESENGT